MMYKSVTYLVLITQLLCIDNHLCSIGNNNVSILNNNNDNYDEENFAETLSKILSLRKRDTDEEPDIPDENNVLSNSTTLSFEPSLPAENSNYKTTGKEPSLPAENSNYKTTGKEPSLPAENTSSHSIHKTTSKEPLLPIENVNITEKSVEHHEPTIPDEGQVTMLSFSTRQEEIIPNELANQIEITKATQHESTLPDEKQFTIFKTTQQKSSLPDENPINRIKRGDKNNNPEPSLPHENLKFDWKKTTKVEPNIVSENTKLLIKTRATEPTIPDEIIIDSHTTVTVVEPTIPSEITRIPFRTTNSEPELPREDTTIMTTADHNTVTTVKAVTESVTQTTTEECNTTTVPDLTTISTIDTTTVMSTLTTDIKTVATTAKITTTSTTSTTTTTTTTSRRTTTTANGDEYYALCGKLCPNNSYCNVDQNSAECVCDEQNGFIRDKTFASLTCKYFTPCDRSFNRCGKAKCIETGKDINRGYRCDCDVGYELVSSHREENNYCKPMKCRYPLMTGCSQLCADTHPDDNGNLNNNPEYSCDCYSGYKLSVDNKNCVHDNSSTCTINCGIYGYCVDNLRCKCKTGLLFNGSHCVIDSEWCARNCDNKCIVNYGNNTKDVMCECDSPNKKLDTQTGLCLTVNHCQSNGDGKRDCDQQNAVCVQTDDKNNTKGYRCECQIGTERVSGKCVAICDIQGYIDECNNNNALCVYDISTVKKFSCDCKPGFFRGTDSNRDLCSIAEHTLKTSLVLRNPYLLKQQKNYYDSNSDNEIDLIYNSLSGEQKSNFIRGDLINQLQRSLDNVKIDGLKGVSMIDCRPIETFMKYECEVTFQMSGNVADGNRKLESVINSCTTPINGTEYCYLPPKTIYAKTKFSAETLKSCVDSNVCQSTSAYTECHPIAHTTRYDCLCPKNTFRVNEVKFNDGLMRIEYCTDVNECAIGKCSGKHQTCINTVGSYMCLCNDGYKNASDSDADCVPVCDNVLCNDGQCVGKRNSFWCSCDTGYSGEYCELKANASIDSGYVIAVSVLALALLVVSLFAAFCLGRAKGVQRESLSSKIPINNNDIRPHFRRTSSIPEVPVRTVYRQRNVEQTYEENQI